jgi:predicted dehydrogenase
MRHFLSILKQEEEPSCSLEDGLRAQRLALAALQSAQEGRRLHLSGERPG